MEKLRKFLDRKDIVLSGRRYGIDALGAMAQGLFCTLLVGTILNTLGQQFDIGFLTRTLVAAPIGTAARAVGQAIMWATELQPFLMGVVMSVLVGIALTLPISFAVITAMDWVGLVLICFVLSAILSWIFCAVLRKWGWIRENDLKLEL